MLFFYFKLSYNEKQIDSDVCWSGCHCNYLFNLVAFYCLNQQGHIYHYFFSFQTNETVFKVKYFPNITEYKSK